MNITEGNTWEPAINRIETTDPLLGGADDSPLNLAVAQLASRTNYLKLALGGFASIVPINTSRALTPTDIILNLVVVDANAATIALVLPGSVDDGMYIGAKAVITAINVNKSQVKISRTGADSIIDGTVAKSTLYLGDGDTIELVLTSLGWVLVNHKGNFDDVGGIVYRYKSIPNTVVAQGQLLNRVDYPRLFEYASGLGGSLISDLSWASNKGFFSTGNGSTTFRVPDLRAMFIRGLDLGAGIDFGRASNNPGDYEADNIKQHTHMTVFDQSYSGNSFPYEIGRAITAIKSMITSWGKSGTGKESYYLYGTDGDQIPNVSPTSSTGGLETTPKNIGLLPLIKI